MSTMAITGTSAVLYTADMTDEPDLEKDLPIFRARNKLAAIIERARYFGGVTYLMNHGRRVAAVVPVEVAERYEAELAARESADS